MLMTFRSLAVWFRATAVTLTLFAGVAAHAQSDSPKSVPGEVLVGVQTGTDNGVTEGKIERVGSIRGKQAHLKAYRVKLKNGITIEQAIASLRELPEVTYAEPNVVLEAFATPDDTYYLSHQYAPQKVQADLAWNIWKPQTQTVVAVVDTGVQTNHPDLAGKVVGGYDFINNDNDPNDDNGHGTHCAGIVGAQINNGTGIAGIAGWNGLAGSDTTYTKIMPVKVLAGDGSGTTSGVADGIIYAADNGAKVISLSLGGGGTTTLANAVNYAVNKGCILVAAAGNSGSTTKSYPAGYSNVLSVASTDSTDTLSSFSNHGAWVKVAAPGQDIASTYTGSGYVYLSGTSMAAPLVAGQAALIRSQNPNLSNVQIEEVIVGNTDPYNSYQSRTIGGGRVNVYRALQAATGGGGSVEPTPTAPAAPTNLAGKAVSRSQINLTWVDNANNEEGFYIERSTDGKTFSIIAELGANATSYSSTGLNAFTFYYYRVRAFNSVGSSAYSNTVQVRTQRK
jgi:thermitase